MTNNERMTIQESRICMFTKYVNHKKKKKKKDENEPKVLAY